MIVSRLPKLTPRDLLTQYIKKKCTNYMPADNFFIKPNDAISVLPLRGMLHDEDVCESIKYLGKYFPDNFVDIGANIGLVSIAVSQYFRKTICVEPNPLVCNILKTNAALNISEFEIHEIGLAKDNKKITLHIPKGNLGGAFVLENNSYSELELAKKDGFDRFELANYVEQDIYTCDCLTFFNKLNLPSKESVTIKLDVEGLDNYLFLEILNLFEDRFRKKNIAIVFESHNPTAIQDLVNTVSRFEYQIVKAKIIKSPTDRNPIVRRLKKLIWGESKMLDFEEFDKSTTPSFTNYVCLPQDMLVRVDIQ